MVNTFIHSCSYLENHTQFPVEDPGEGPAPPGFLRRKMFFLETDPPPPSSPYLRVWMTGLPFISRTGSGTDSRPKWAKSIPVYRKNPTLWGGTYLYGLYKGVLPRGWVYGLSIHKIFVCIHIVVRPSSCGTSSEGHYTSFTTKCRRYVLPAVNF